MNICKKCGLETANEKFCGHSCAASYNNKGIRRHGNKPHYCSCGKKINSKCTHCRECYLNLKSNDYNKLGWNKYVEKYMLRTITPLLRDMILKEQEKKCIVCGNDIWLKQDIPLEIHHKDGNKKNMERENLEGICPNCHYFTDNYKFRGRTHFSPTTRI